jgi:hypothetical protein
MIFGGETMPTLTQNKNKNNNENITVETIDILLKNTPQTVRINGNLVYTPTKQIPDWVKSLQAENSVKDGTNGMHTVHQAIESEETDAEFIVLVEKEL